MWSGEYAERLKTLESTFDPCYVKKANKANHNKKKIWWIYWGQPQIGEANTCGSESKFKQKNRVYLVHSKGCSHSTHQCKVLTDHARKVKGQYKAQAPRAKAYKKPATVKSQDNPRTCTYSQKEVEMLLKRIKWRKEEKSWDTENLHVEPIEPQNQDSKFVDLLTITNSKVNDKLDLLFAEEWCNKNLPNFNTRLKQLKIRKLESEQECFIQSSIRSKKWQKALERSPEVVVEKPTMDKNNNPHILQCLHDNGSLGCIILHEFMAGLDKL